MLFWFTIVVSRPDIELRGVTHLESTCLRVSMVPGPIRVARLARSRISPHLEILSKKGRERSSLQETAFSLYLTVLGQKILFDLCLDSGHRNTRTSSATASTSRVSHSEVSNSAWLFLRS